MKGEGFERTSVPLRTIDDLLDYLNSLRGAKREDMLDATHALYAYRESMNNDEGVQEEARKRVKDAFAVIGITLKDNEPRS